MRAGLRRPIWREIVSGSPLIVADDRFPLSGHLIMTVTGGTHQFQIRLTGTEVARLAAEYALAGGRQQR